MLKLAWNDGHTLTGKGTGAAGIIKETDRNRAIGALTRKKLLEQYDDISILNCTIDKSNNDMTDAVKMANDWKADVFISNHVNDGGGYGFEGFYSVRASSATISKGKIIYDELIKTKSCLKDRRYMAEEPYIGYEYYVLKNTNMPAYLFEIGFVDSQKCVNAVNNEEVAQAYVNGIARAYNLKKKNSNGNGNTNNNNEKVEFDMKYIVQYGNEVDKRTVEFLTDALKCPSIDARNPFDYGKVETVIAIGGITGPVQFSGYTKYKIAGNNRFDTAKKIVQAAEEINNGKQVSEALLQYKTK